MLLTPSAPSGNAARDDKNKVEKRQGPQTPEAARTTALEAEVSLETIIKDFIDSEKGRREQERADEKRWWPPTPSWAIVYATFFYILVAVGQLWAIYYQATIAKRTITHFERPWVRVDPKDPTLPDKELPFGTTIPWTATNVGKSPAFVTRLFVDVKIFPRPVPPDQRPQYGDPPRIARFMLSPHGGQHSSERRLSGEEPRPFSAGDLRDMWHGETCLVFYGFIDYLDAVGTSHTTRFCSYWDHNFVFNPVGPPDWVEYT